MKNLATILTASAIATTVTVSGAITTGTEARAAKIDTGDIAKQAVTNRKIKKRTIKSNRIRKNAVKSKHIKDGKVKSKDLHKKAKPSGAAFSENTAGSFAIGTDPTIMRQLTLKLPGPGIVVANASGDPLVFGDGNFVKCAINDQKETAQSPQQTAQPGSRPISLVRAFAVTGSSITVYFVCKGNVEGHLMWDQVLVAFFVPGTYGDTVVEGAPAQADRGFSNGSKATR